MKIMAFTALIKTRKSSVILTARNEFDNPERDINDAFFVILTAETEFDSPERDMNDALSSYPRRRVSKNSATS
ncbi:MAG: hypothetical protein LBB59_02075 [Campylobacteraceae bacterium]|nr:hypothetical protein [Campylobacteraceae bacterium]